MKYHMKLRPMNCGHQQKAALATAGSPHHAHLAPCLEGEVDALQHIPGHVAIACAHILHLDLCAIVEPTTLHPDKHLKSIRIYQNITTFLSYISNQSKYAIKKDGIWRRKTHACWLPAKDTAVILCLQSS